MCRKILSYTLIYGECFPTSARESVQYTHVSHAHHACTGLLPCLYICMYVYMHLFDPLHRPTHSTQTSLLPSCEPTSPCSRFEGAPRTSLTPRSETRRKHCMHTNTHGHARARQPSLFEPSGPRACPSPSARPRAPLGPLLSAWGTPLGRCTHAPTALPCPSPLRKRDRIVPALSEYFRARDQST